MNRKNQWTVLLPLGLLLFGLCKLWPEEQITRSQIQAGLKEKDTVALEMQEKVGQKAFAIALGGYRSVVATWFYLLASDAWEQWDWDLLEQRFRIVTTLQPKEEEYWLLGGWHLAYNASVNCLENPDFSPTERQLLWREYIYRGNGFFLDGARQNPQSWKLWRQIGSLWSDRYKIIDREKAWAAYSKAASVPGSPRYLRRFVLYQQANVKDEESRRLALDYARELWQNPAERTTSVLLNFFFLSQELEEENKQDVEWFVAELNQVLPVNDEEKFYVLEDFLKLTERLDSALGQQLLDRYRPQEQME